MTAFNDNCSDGTLIAAVLAGDTEQFEVLVTRYERPLLRVAHSRMGRPEWAEDVVQETFLCAFKSLHTYNSQFSFRTWLWTILLNQCRRQLKKFSRGLFIGAWSQPTSDDNLRATLADQLKSDESPSARMATRERSELLDALLAKLPEGQADALRLRFFGGNAGSRIVSTEKAVLKSSAACVACHDGMLSEGLSAARHWRGAAIAYDRMQLHFRRSFQVINLSLLDARLRASGAMEASAPLQRLAWRSDSIPVKSGYLPMVTCEADRRC